MELLLATGNDHKIGEMTALLNGVDVTIRTPRDVGGGPDIEETGVTYDENARLKAEAWARHAGLPALADDSGLEVDALGGRPGVKSSRYAPTDGERIARLLGELDGVALARRTARFVCVMALAWPGGRVETRRGVCEGAIALAPSGGGGFGYDPVFVLAGRTETMAEIGEDEKNRVSHRAGAAEAIKTVLAGRR